MKLHAEQIRAYVPRRYLVLGTDGFGRSDTRQALRRHFEVDRQHVAVAALAALADEGAIDAKQVAQAVERYGLDVQRKDPAEP
ncbi:Pyruvate dehydrogenase E1 component [compost metagenome]